MDVLDELNKFQKKKLRWEREKHELELKLELKGLDLEGKNNEVSGFWILFKQTSSIKLKLIISK